MATYRVVKQNFQSVRFRDFEHKRARMAQFRNLKYLSKTYVMYLKKSLKYVEFNFRCKKFDFL